MSGNKKFEIIQQQAGKDDVGELDAQVTVLAAYFNGLLTAKESTQFQLMAQIGIRQNALQEEAREKFKNDQKLMELETLLKGKEGSFFSGNVDLPSVQTDALLLCSLHSIFVELFDDEVRSQYPNILGWVNSCLAKNKIFAKVLGDHMLGKQRIGNQIDSRANPKVVRGHADFTRDLNAGFKKKATQRQQEKAAAAAAAVEQAKKAEKEAAELKFTIGDEKILPSMTKEEKIKAMSKILDNMGIAYRCVEHKASPDMASLKEAIGSEPGIRCMNLFLKAKKPNKDIENDSGLWLVVVPDNAKVSIDGLSKQLGYNKKSTLRKGPEAMLESALGVIPGEVTPFALLNDKEARVHIILDQAMMQQESEKLWFHPLTNEASFEISTTDLAKYVKASARHPRIIEFPRQ